MYCKKCGKLISDDSEYCSYCGTKQTLIDNKDFSLLQDLKTKIYSPLLKVKEKKTDNNNVVSIPEGFAYCAYCGKVKSEDNFKISRDETFHRCKSCEQREKYLKWTLIGLTLIALFFITIIAVEEEGIEGLMVVFGLLVTGIAILPGLLLYFLIEKILEFTPYRISLSPKREAFVLELKDTNGNSVSTPIVRLPFEEEYRLKTGHYRSRDIPYNHFRCPVCGNIHPISEQNHITDDADRETSYKGTWLGTARITSKTNYRYRICESCSKLTKISDVLYPIVGISITLATPIIYGLLEGFTLWRVVGMSILGFFSGALISLIVNILYRLFVWLFTDKWLFVNYGKAAYYGALVPIKTDFKK